MAAGKRKRASLIDQLIAVNIRALRQQAGLSQMSVAASLEISYQQYQKYEQGTNRIGASRLYLLAKLFQIEIDEFYRNVGGTGLVAEPGAGIATEEMSMSFRKIRNADMRRVLSLMVRTLADEAS